MLYLEDYVELIEHLPIDVRERLGELRDMDLQIQTGVDTLNGRVKDLFGKCAAKKGKISGADQTFETIQTDYYKVLEDADEKVQLANQIYDLVDRHLRKLDQELSKFKMELEADNAGITEILEQRSLELDNPVSLQRSGVRERKRAHTSQASSSGCGAGTSGYVNNDGLRPEKCVKLDLPIETDQGNSQPHMSTDSGNGSYGEKSLASLTDSNVNIPSSDICDETEDHDISEASFTLPSSTHEHDITVIAHDVPRRSQKTMFDSLRIEHGHRLNETDGLSIDSLDTSGEHISDSSLSSIHGPGVQRPSRTKKQTSKAAAWVQERKQQAEARHEQKKKDNVSSGSGAHDSADEGSGVEVVGENPSTVDWNCDPNEPRYCLCNQISYGEMVGCDNDKCTIEWFHYGCVNLTEAPKGKWYCPQCTQTMKRRHKR